MIARLTGDGENYTQTTQTESPNDDIYMEIIMS